MRAICTLAVQRFAIVGMRGALSLQETASLLAVFAEDRPFEATGHTFSRTFQRADQFKACCAITLLVQVVICDAHIDAYGIFRKYLANTSP